MGILESPQPGAAPSAQATARPRIVGIWGLAFMAYMAVCSGPYGIEDAVRAAGPFPTLAAIVVLPVIWGLPQSLMTAELSTMMPDNGGYVLWAQRGLGPFAGFLNSYNSIASNWFDLPTYPVLFLQYVEATFVPLSTAGRLGLKFASLAFVFASNVAGLAPVTYFSVLMSVLVILPFVVEPAVADEDVPLHTSHWFDTNESINWGLFMSTLIWNYQGWDSLGCIAGEVRNVGRSYPIGIFLALTLMTVNYFTAVAVGAAIEPDTSQWTEGLFETIAKRISPAMGYWVASGAFLATLAEFNVVMATSSRALWAAACDGQAPACLRYESKRFGTPVAAIAAQTLVCAVGMNISSFADLVVLDTMCNNVSLLLEFGSFLRLRYTEPDTPRPYKIPGGNVGAWLITLPKFCVVMGVMLTQVRCLRSGGGPGLTPPAVVQHLALLAGVQRRRRGGVLFGGAADAGPCGLGGGLDGLDCGRAHAAARPVGVGRVGGGAGPDVGTVRCLDCGRPCGLDCGAAARPVGVGRVGGGAGPDVAPVSTVGRPCGHDCGRAHAAARPVGVGRVGGGAGPDVGTVRCLDCGRPCGLDCGAAARPVGVGRVGGGAGLDVGTVSGTRTGFVDPPKSRSTPIQRSTPGLSIH